MSSIPAQLRRLVCVFGPRAAGEAARRRRARAWSLPVALLCSLFQLQPSSSAGSDASPPAEPAGSPAPARWHWRRLPVPSSGQGLGLTAVAVDPGTPAPDSAEAPSARLAVGDGGGVSLRDDGGPFRFAARTRGVTDLHFGPQGALWIASLRGLWHLSPEGELSDRSPAPGEHARTVRRVELAAGLVCVGTDAGAWISSDALRWRRIADGLPAGPVPALAIRSGEPSRPGAPAELWLVSADALWRMDARAEPDGVRLGPAERVGVPGTPAGVPAVDVLVGLPGVRVAVAYPQLIAFARDAATARRADSGDAGASSLYWQVARPALPPGAQTRRLVAAAGAIWLATDLGLLTAPDVDGPWRRSGRPAGAAPIRAIAAAVDGVALLAAGEQGLFRGTPSFLASADSGSNALAAPSAAAFSAAEGPGPSRRGAAFADPDIRSVQRAGLRYLALEPQRFDELRSGLARRGWLPTLSLRLAGGGDREHQRDYDEAFLSGQTRHLRDYEKDRSFEYDASVVLSWDFGDLAFSSDAVDLSRESRLVISLRDGVLDEINQLYFERRALLQQLAAGPAADGPDPRQLELRAAELAAGLDAWTGGWFSDVRAARATALGEKSPDG